MFASVAHAAPVVARLVDVTLHANNNGAPGANASQTLLDALAGYGLMAALACVVIGAAVLGLSHRFGNSMSGGRAREAIIGGFGAGAVIGIAPTVLNWVFHLFGG